MVALIICLASCVSASVHAGPSGGSVRDRVRAYRRAHEHEILQAFVELLAIPSVRADQAGLRRTADKIVALLAARGVTAKLLEQDGAPPVVFADLGTPGDRRKTVLLYAHYDGQPVDPSEWKSPPFEPTIRIGDRHVELPAAGQTIDPEARVFARGAGDDKSGVMGIITALEAIKASGLAPSVHVKVMFEGEEEINSPHLRATLDAHAAELACDAVLFADGPAEPDETPIVSLGVRGFDALELTVYGPNRTLHSGHYGNWAPNPIVLLTHLIDSMRDADAAILIPGFREAVRPLTDGETRLLAALPSPDADLRRELGLAWTEGGGAALAERILHPALNLRGISSGHVEALATNSVPTEARASIDFRLVPDLTPEKVRKLVEDHVRAQGFYIVHADPDVETRLAHPRIIKLTWGNGYPATRTPPEAPIARALVQALQQAKLPIVEIPSGGGSLPTYMFGDVLHAPLVIVSVANHDDNQHAPNENLRIANLWSGIELYATALVELGRTWR